MSRRDQYGDPEDYQDPLPWLPESPVGVVALVLYGVGMLGLLACAAFFVLRWVRA
jgi:hypothetical protein